MKTGKRNCLLQLLHLVQLCLLRAKLYQRLAQLFRSLVKQQKAITAFGEGFTLAKAGFPALGAEASKFGVALAGISAPMIAIAAVVAVLVAAFATLWKTNEGFRDNMTKNLAD